MTKSSNPENETAPVHPDQEIIDFFLACAQDAREGRVLFVMASVGVVKPPVPPGPLDPVGPPTNRFAVNVGAFVASRTQLVEPVSLASACEDVRRGAAYAADQVTARCTAALPQEPPS